MNPLLTKLLAVSGSVAFTLIGLALYKRRKRALLSDPNTLNPATLWEIEKSDLQQDKIRLEGKLFELEAILERMSKEIESLKASLKEKNKIITTQEQEKERWKDQEHKTRSESENTIEQLQRRAQHFLRELEAKSLLCDQQAQLVLNLQGDAKQQEMLLEALQVEHQVLMAEHQSLQGSLLSDDTLQDIRYLLSLAVRSATSSANLVEEPSKISPLLVGIGSIQDPTLVSIYKKYAQQFNGELSSVDNGSSNGVVSFSVSVDGANGVNGSMKGAHHTNGNIETIVQ